MTGFPKRVREQVLNRAHQHCEKCGLAATAYQWHHRRPRGAGGSKAPDTNLASKIRLELVKSNVAGSATNTSRPLTHPLVTSKKGASVNATQPCSVDGCDRPMLARGWCGTHWARWRKHGTTDLRPATQWCAVEDCEDPPRSTYADYCETHYYRLRRTGSVEGPKRIEGTCEAEGCTAPATSSGSPIGVDGVFCRMHYLRLKKRGDTSFEFRGENNPNWTGEEATNGAVHQRIRKERGHARNYACVDCGGQAAHWSYDHTADDERFCPEKGPYTVDQDHYEPRCVSCHKKFDLNRIKGREQRYE